ncbi:serine/threonine-protein phosphatase 6 regulatory ankyrin repeat subunit A [Aplysia californica]|uniref:Serine/threonine-protein phosphatase 6 regulatory ankyrin repeat subunit A n=1 Tax=Aplysia californica TaxID=6500 RepID=A0ABM0JPH9_APLCA|nr:serine/threonine-protein phosphatase 6 regulatory ankyrin repeat subunit A [Aplysia californica]
MEKQGFQGASSHCQKDEQTLPRWGSMCTASKPCGQNAQSSTIQQSSQTSDGDDTLRASVSGGQRSLQGTVYSSKSHKKGQKQASQNTTNGGHQSSLASARKSCRSSDSETPTKRQRKSKCDKTVGSASSCTSRQDHHFHFYRRKNQRSNQNTAPWFTKLSKRLFEAVEAGRSNKVAEILKNDGKCLLSVLDVALHKAVSQGHLSIVQNLMHHGANLYTQILGQTCFHIAAEKGHVHVIQFILGKKVGGGIFSNFTFDFGGNTPLILCQGTSSAAHITKIILSHSRGAAINVQNLKGETALIKAVQSRNISAVHQLVMAGANMNLNDMKGNTAKSIATAMGMYGLLEVLAKDTGGQGLTPIMTAVRAQNTDLLAALLMSKQFDVDEKVNTGKRGKDSYTDTALTMILNSKLDARQELLRSSIDWKSHLHNFEQLTFKELDIIAMLVRAGANIHVWGRYGYYNSPFQMAVELGDGRLLDVLLKNEKGIGNCDSYATALGVAARNGRCDLIDALTPGMAALERYFVPKQKWNRSFHNTLNDALRVGNEECVGKLLKIFKNIDFDSTITVAIKSGRYPVFLMVQNACLEQFHQQVSGDEGTKWLCAAITSNSLAIIENLILNGADVNKCCRSFVNGRCTDSALEQAVLSNLTEVVKILMKHGATLNIDILTLALSHHQCMAEMRKLLLSYDDIDPNQINSQGQLPLSVAAFHGDLESVETLIKKGADVNFKGNPLSRPALISAVVGKNVEVARYLLDCGADVNTKNPSGETALTKAARTDDGSIVSLLIEKGAWLNVSNYEDLTALMLAASCKNFPAFRCLMEAGADFDLRCHYNYNETLLTMLLSEKSYSVFARFIVCLVRHGAKVSTGEAMLAVHNSIALGNFHVLSALIHYGGFNPTLFKDIHVKKTPPFCKAKGFLIADFAGVFSPLCMALLCGHMTVARDMLQASYLTTSDLTLLPRHTKVREFLNRRRFDESVAVLNEMSVSVPSLQQICFVRVSDMCGSEPGRKEKVRQLELPDSIERSLLFSCRDQLIGGKCCMAENSSETTPAKVRERKDNYIIFTGAR